MRLTVELTHGESSRLQGTVRAADGNSEPFDGVLDLLRILESLDPAMRPAPVEQPRPPTGRHADD